MLQEVDHRTYYIILQMWLIPNLAHLSIEGKLDFDLSYVCFMAKDYFMVNSNFEINLTQAVSILKYSHCHSKSWEYAAYYQVASTSINHIQIERNMSKLSNGHNLDGG